MVMAVNDANTGPFDIEAALANDPRLGEYLKGQGYAMRAWSGSRDSLKRRKQVPDPSYTPADVVQLCLRALQNNDEPQLDHGACVVLEFKSPSGVLAEGGLDPAGYGHFLRTTMPYSILIDFSKAELKGSEVQLKDSLSVRQEVIVKGLSGDTALFDFYLSKHDNTWLIDAILAK
jgi:hypothetical protein